VGGGEPKGGGGRGEVDSTRRPNVKLCRPYLSIILYLFVII
jgi:hypothetical protein